MRTKALLVAAGVLAAAATSMAQSNVYSLNVVGYVNVHYTNGFQLVANQLHTDSTGTNDTLLSAYGTNQLPNATRLHMFTVGTGFSFATYNSSSGAWTGDTTAATKALAAGGGSWLEIRLQPAGTQGNVTYVGEVKQGTTTLPVATGFQIMSLAPPISTAIDNTGAVTPGYPKATNDRIHRFVNPTGFGFQRWTGSAWTGGSPIGTPPTPNVGESFYVERVLANGATTWTQTYNVPQ